MSPTLEAFLRSWPFDPWLLAGLALTAVLYCRGWRLLHRRDPERWSSHQPAFFLSGLVVLFLALASPIEPFAVLLLQVHMLQHLLLMMAAAPLLWLGAPFFPLLRGLPRPIRTVWIGPLFRLPWLRRFCEWLTHPLMAWPLYVAATWLWHVPGLYALALRSDAWHYLQHLTFLGTALLFWYPVIRPYPARPRWSLWLLLPYLLLADVQNTALSALFTFSSTILYPHYAAVPSLGNGSALEDQAAAGVLMWVPGSVAFLLPLFWIGVELLYGQGRWTGRARRTRAPAKRSGRLALPLVSAAAPAQFDLLHVPLLGRFLHWRHARVALQVPLLALAALLIYDGLTGPQIGAMNLAGVLPWVHWRGLVVLGLLAAGNVFCFGCPFLLPRTIARRWLPAGRVWPRRLRNKWPAVVLLLLFLWAYEAFALWDSPWLTAWIALAYFAGAVVIDGLFRGAPFCKYLCPIGQFNFVQSLVSPLEVKVRDPGVCAVCRTKDCIRGRDGIPGCELHLYQPRKAGNMDCTFCLDCVHACPHDNVGMVVRAPASELWHDRSRSGIGRFSARPDLAALVLLLVFGAFANAAGMVGPVVTWQERLGQRIGAASPALIATLCYIFALIVLPVGAVGSAATLSRRWGGGAVSRRAVATRYAFALVPLGFGMWLAHYSFHFLTGCDAVVPVSQRFLADLRWPLFGEPEWIAACCRPVAGWLLRLEIVSLDIGLLLSLYTAYRTARAQSPRPLRAFAPWAVLLLLLFAAGVWIVLQPMQMRGMLEMAG
jgi:cytochrome c oxidase assembly factor CtaG/polyferredoxin